MAFKDHLSTMFYTVFQNVFNVKVQACLKLCEGKVNHLNLKQVPAGSTLSDVNKKDK